MNIHTISQLSPRTPLGPKKSVKQKETQIKIL